MLLGEPALQERDVLAALKGFGLEARVEGGFFHVEAAPYRMDYIHEVDAVEDYAMSHGYEHFSPLMPEEFTVGRLDERTEFADRARDRMIGYGFEEAIANILTEERLLRAAMNVDAAATPLLHGATVVKIANVMNASYSCLRDWLLPSLLEIEAHSAGAVYPHRVFEAGEVAIADSSAPLGSRTEQHVGALVAHETASFSEAQAHLNLLLLHLGIAPAGTDVARSTLSLEPGVPP